jgi:hypothetical protein
MRFTPSQTGFAGFGSAGREFHHTSLTCPQIKHRSSDRAGPAPAQATEASRLRLDAARIALLPLRKIRHGQLIASNALTHD